MRIPVAPSCLVLLTFLFGCSANDTRNSSTGSGGSAAGGGVGTGGSGTGGIGFGGSGNTGGSPECGNTDQKTSSGCDYYAVDPEIMFDAAGGCYAVFVVNPWEFDITVNVDFKGQVLDASTFGYIPNGSGDAMNYFPLENSVIPPGQIAILFLNRYGFSPLGLNTDCPAGIVPAITNVDAATHGTAMGNAFHISTTAPVVAYDIYPYGGGQSALTSATLLLPTSSWGDNYIGVSAFGSGLFIAVPTLAVVAHENGTAVTINPNVDIAASPTVGGTTKGVPVTYNLEQGQVLQFAQGPALEGSIIQSNHNVGVWAGASALGIESCCDESAHQQIPPVRALGSEYVGVRYRNRYDGVEESPPWRMVGAIAGTTLTWEPSAPPGAPTTLDVGQVVQFNAAGPFVVRSQDTQHPFYMSAHMTGAAAYDPEQNGTGGKADGRGDAEFVNVIPPGEYLNRYVFFTDPTYPETNLVITRTKGPSGFEDVVLDCAGPLSGWQPIGSSGNFEYTYFDLSRGNFEAQGNCNNGRHEITSNLPFGLTVWGWGSAATGAQFIGFYSQYVSYAYPGGASVAPINDVVIPVIK